MIKQRSSEKSQKSENMNGSQSNYRKLNCKRMNEDMLLEAIPTTEIEAEFIYYFKKHGAEGFSYDPIVASGKNSCILHYEQRHRSSSRSVCHGDRRDSKSSRQSVYGSSIDFFSVIGWSLLSVNLISFKSANPSVADIL